MANLLPTSITADQLAATPLATLLSDSLATVKEIATAESVNITAAGLPTSFGVSDTATERLGVTLTAIEDALTLIEDAE